MTVEDLRHRVERLEADVAQIRDWRIDTAMRAQAYGLSLVHEDTQALRADLEALRTEVREGFAEILRRLPPAPAASDEADGTDWAFASEIDPDESA